ncbi:helix-turn-helix domain-containing protein [Planctomyces sp. SH-PL14]|jgi:transcriptional regulator with XRE-family HTH domain|uniref:helix-turn-helix domain-containing protein n=1 Tax=Planctomyces sp. SH-PL14 TaxID=1632864 RepID=UPI00078EE9BA|nr:XRE family transcriptional regulator [Planctomyces sp. SH-PL14]AMV19813.1 HTH-type transcriptional regulator SinR [Planctomyces sp. SH-PL14]
MARRPAEESGGTGTGSNADVVGMQLSQRIKALRGEKGWSLERLSAACGVSRSMLSQIERGLANPTLGVTLRIAEAFDLTIGEFVEHGPKRGSTIHVVRGNDPAHTFRSDEHVTLRTLSPLHLEKDTEFYELVLEEGAVLSSAPHFPKTREFLTVVQGKVRVTSGSDVSELARGDSATYAADVSHEIANTGRGKASLFLVVSYR